MDSDHSLRLVHSFEAQIAAMKTSKKDEQFVREFVSELVLDCPLDILTSMAQHVVDLRKAELRDAAQQN